MKTIFNILVLVFVVSGFALGQSAWQWINPRPQGNGLSDVELLDAVTAVVVGNHGTIMKTTNAGTSWAVTVVTEAGWRGFGAVDFFNSSLGIAVGDEGLFAITTDGGASWERKDIGTTNSLAAVAIINDSTVIVVGIQYGYGPTAELMRSTNLGNDWTYYSTRGDGLYAMAFVTSNAGSVLGRDGLNLYTSDGGISWDSSRYETRAFIGGLNYSSRYKGWAVGSYWTGTKYTPTVLRTLNGGQSWTSVNIGIDSVKLQDVCFINDNSGFIFANDGKVIKTTNAGFSWSMETISWFDLKSAAFQGNLGIVVGQDGYLASTANAGANWATLSVNIVTESAGLYGIKFLDGHNALAVTRNGFLLKTTDQGDSWTSRNVGNRFYGVDFSGSNGLIVGSTSGTYYPVVLASTDNGTTWINKPVDSSFGLTNFQKVNMTSGASAYALGSFGGGSGVLKSTNLGDTWLIIIDSLIYDAKISFKDQFGLVVSNSSLQITTDGGATWTLKPINNGVSSYLVYDCFALSDGVGYIIAGDVSGVTYLLKTTDYGTQWQPLWSTGQYIEGLYFYNDLVGLVYGGSYIAATSDGGNSWWDGRYSFRDIIDVDFANAQVGLLVGHDGMIMKTTMGGITNIGDRVGLPRQFALQQNYPNPFNPATTINYSLPQTEWVTVRVYNLLGSEVATLVDEKKNPGNYQVTWNGERFSSGVYFYKISTGTDVSVKKMVLIK